MFDSLGEAQVEPKYFSALLSGGRHTASLVCSATGDFVDDTGSSKRLGGEVDKLWLKALRAKSDVVLTSGKTYRAEQYKMPKRADLAILSRFPVDQSELVLNQGQSVVEFNEGGAVYTAEVLVQKGYRNIHIEFGPTGMAELLNSSFAFDLWLSGLDDSSVNAGAKRLGVKAQIIARVAGLSIALAR